MLGRTQARGLIERIVGHPEGTRPIKLPHKPPTSRPAQLVAPLAIPQVQAAPRQAPASVAAPERSPDHPGRRSSAPDRRPDPRSVRGDSTNPASAALPALVQAG